MYKAPSLDVLHMLDWFKENKVFLEIHICFILNKIIYYVNAFINYFFLKVNGIVV
jgi:hypothetical protein